MAQRVSLPFVPGTLNIEASVIMLCSCGGWETDTGQYPKAPGPASPTYTASINRKPWFKCVEGKDQFSSLFPHIACGTDPCQAYTKTCTRTLHTHRDGNRSNKGRTVASPYY